VEWEARGMAGYLHSHGNLEVRGVQPHRMRPDRERDEIENWNGQCRTADKKGPGQGRSRALFSVCVQYLARLQNMVT